VSYSLVVRVRVGIDTGGTFTDLVRVNATQFTVQKVRTTTSNPARGMLDGLAAIARTEPVEVVHGSTIATNAVLERKGAAVALVTTTGFEDVLRIGRQTRPDLYDVFVESPRPLVDPALTFGVGGRLDAAGLEIEPIDDLALGGLADAIAAAGPAIVAVCLLHSYANPAHERLVAGRLRARGLLVCASHEVLPEYREYERWSTTVLNAYVTPAVDRYLGDIEASIGASARLSIMQSNGGSLSAAAARAQAVRTVLSGPAAGVVGARVVGQAAGHQRVIAFDMGGTSTDVSLLDGGVPTTNESTIGDFPLRLPVVDIHTVGAGGGSVARIDSGGALVVGPESAGADPGPACYGQGDRFTVTDANLILGRLDPGRFFGGRMPLDERRAHAAALRLAEPLGLTVEALAAGVVRVANASMERAIRVVSVERGHDPRRFALVAFGGAGGMHACEIAVELAIGEVLVPRHAGVLSALGMLMADVRRDYSATVPASEDAVRLTALAPIARPLVEAASRDLAAEGFGPARRTIERWLDVRYAGQSSEIAVPWSAGYRKAFDREHRRLYGYADADRAIEIVAIRVRATGITDKPVLPNRRVSRSRPARPAETRRVWFDGRPVPCARFAWEALGPGDRGSGPALVTGGEASAVVPPRCTFAIDGFGNIAIRTPAYRRGPFTRRVR
jgi:N-methylhydantoinase A/oxoprolinase/acetone carboxylase beta subunit